MNKMMIGACRRVRMWAALSTLLCASARLVLPMPVAMSAAHQHEPSRGEPDATDDDERLTVGIVQPAGIADSGAKVMIRVRVTPESDNRLLRIVVDSEDYYRSSDVQLDGLNSASLHVLQLRELPSGQYTVLAQLYGTEGTLARAADRFFVLSEYRD